MLIVERLSWSAKRSSRYLAVSGKPTLRLLADQQCTSLDQRQRKHIPSYYFANTSKE